MGITFAGSLPRDTFGFTYKGLHSGRDFDMWLTKSPIDFLVGSRDALEERPWGAGSYDFGAALESRAIEMELVIRATSEANLREKRRAIAAWLSPAKGLGELWWDTEPSKYYDARRYGSESALSMVARQGEFTLNFIAPDPYAYSRTEQPITFSGMGTRTVINEGSVEASPVVEVKGTNTIGQLSLTFGGATFTFNGPLSAGETLMIDFDGMTAYKIVKGERVNVLAYTNDKFPLLQVGNNTVQVGSVGFTISEIVFHPKSRWE